MMSLNPFGLCRKQFRDLVLSSPRCSNATEFFALLQHFISHNMPILGDIDEAFGPGSSNFHFNGFIFELFNEKKIILFLNDFILREYEKWSSGELDSDSLAGDISMVAPGYGIINGLAWNDTYKGVIVHALEVIVNKRVIEQCKDNYEEYHLASLSHWLTNQIGVFLGLIYPHDKNSCSSKTNINRILLSLSEFICLSLAKLRSSEMFEVITEYPDSLPAILELKEVFGVLSNTSGTQSTSVPGGGRFSHTYTTKDLGNALRHILNRRLLHPGASTVQILDVYVTMI